MVVSGTGPCAQEKSEEEAIAEHGGPLHLSPHSGGGHAMPLQDAPCLEGEGSLDRLDLFICGHRIIGLVFVDMWDGRAIFVARVPMETQHLQNTCSHEDAQPLVPLPAAPQSESAPWIFRCGYRNGICRYVICIDMWDDKEISVARLPMRHNTWFHEDAQPLAPLPPEEAEEKAQVIFFGGAGGQGVVGRAEWGEEPLVNL